MKTLLFLSALLSTLCSVSQTPIKYEINLDNIVHHEIRVSISIPEIDSDRVLIKMPDASPGRYAVHQFAKNIYDEKAYNENNMELSVRKVTPKSWLIETVGEPFVFDYTLYANHADGTYSGIDAEKLLLNIPATFAYVDKMDNHPIEVFFDLRDYRDWTVATQLKRIDDEHFWAPDYDYFYDSPIMVGDINWRSWDVDDQTIEIAMLHEGTEEELNDYTTWIMDIVNTQKKIFGELPNFDFGRYTFLTAYNPWVYGDGMEHRNSTVCTSQRNLRDDAKRLIGTISHEFFHTWNVERIRPASLEPFDFDQPNMSEALWFAEGFTSYYDDLVLCRAGILSKEDYIRSLTGTLNYVINSPARQIRNPIEMSMHAPFVDAANANDETNYANTYVSYYSYGAVLGLILDLSLRTEFKSLSLDDFMRNVWIDYGKTEIPYTLTDLRTTLTTTTADEAFAGRFFDEYIYDSHLPELKQLLSDFGVEMTLSNPDQVYFGYTSISNEARLESTVIRGTAWYEANVEKGDIILEIDGNKVSDQLSFDAILTGLKPGKTYEIAFLQMGKRKTGSFTALVDPSFRVELNQNPKRKQLKLQEAWLEANQ